MRMLAALTLLMLASPACAAPQPGVVDWLQPVGSELPLRSEEEKQRGIDEGRPLPDAEPLQPGLDPRLTEFAPSLDSEVSGRYNGTTSDILPGLVNAWIAAFAAYYPNVNIVISPPFAGSLGMLDVIEGRLDFVFVSRELKPTDIESFNAKYGYAPFTVAISGGSYRHYGFLDAIGFFVHPDNPITGLTLQQLDSLFSTTRNRGGSQITTWGELGLGGAWKAQPVHLYGIKPWNGFEEFVRQRVLDFDGKRGEWRQDIRFSPTAFPVATQVAADVYGIGYTGLAYLTDPVRVLPLSAANDGGDYLAPTYENVASADYPLARLMYFNANRPPGSSLDPALEEFLRFILSRQGQQIILDQAIYLPLRSDQAAGSLAALD